MKKRKYTGDEAIVAYGKVSEAIGKIANDKEIMEKMQEDQFGALADIMSKYKSEVFTVLSTVVDGEIEFENVGADFLQIFSEHFKRFDNDFFNSKATTE